MNSQKKSLDLEGGNALGLRRTSSSRNAVPVKQTLVSIFGS